MKTLLPTNEGILKLVLNRYWISEGWIRSWMAFDQVEKSVGCMPHTGH